IGRLLHDSKLIFEDQLAAIENDSKKMGTTGDRIDLALLVDGLQSEREQGITIDVAYRYFSTDKRKFIIADTPGHEQYTRNMATGASNCDIAIILIDARYGVQVQTRRHSFICSLLGIKQVIVAINKMDLVEFSQARYEEIKADYQTFVKTLNIANVEFAPISALEGDNVVHRSENTPWYQGETLMTLLETTVITANVPSDAFRLQVQYVNRPHLDFRGFCGTIASGSIAVGDEIIALPSRKTSKIASIVDFDGEMARAHTPQAITLTLEDQIDISRGEMIVKPSAIPQSSHTVVADVVWMYEDALVANREFHIKHGSKLTTGHVLDFQFKVDVNTMAHDCEAVELALNEIGRCVFHANEKLHFDAYDDNQSTGAFIIIDRITNITVGAAMIVGSADAPDEGLSEGPIEGEREDQRFSDFELELNALVRKHFPHWHARDLSALMKSGK
ncbi:MAG: sulfate adenylyltransferase subunit CysN, partial [Algicola sp.]|nr:sulfate adenylyltransferase subunit CysN [Algicola sp.]